MKETDYTLSETDYTLSVTLPLLAKEKFYSEFARVIYIQQEQCVDILEFYFSWSNSPFFRFSTIMKFKLLTIISAVIAVSRCNAQLKPCDTITLVPIATGDEAAECSKTSGFSLVMASATGKPSKPGQYPAFCKSNMCRDFVKKLYELVPTDCALWNGKSLKSFIEPVINPCGPLAPAPASQPIRDRDTKPSLIYATPPAIQQH